MNFRQRASSAWRALTASETETLPPYEGAGSGPRSRDRIVQGGGPNSLISGHGDTLRRNSRQIIRNTGWATSAISAHVANIVGDGIRPCPSTGEDRVDSLLTEIWEEWIHESASDGSLDYYGTQALAVRSVVSSGDYFSRVRPRRTSDRLVVPIQLEAIEADRVPLWKNEQTPAGNKIVAGVEFNSIGRRVAYHVLKEHPEESGLFGSFGGETVRVPADRVRHLYNPLRPSAARGEPWFSSALIALEQMHEYLDSEAERKKVAAMIAVLVEQPDSIADPAVDGVQLGSVDDQQRLITGTAWRFGPGEKASTFDPADSGDSFEPFLKAMLRQVAAGLLVTYEQLTGDFSDANFTSYRAALMDRRIEWSRHQRQLIIHQMARPDYHAFVDAAVLSGAISIPNYSSDLRRWRRAEWRVPPFPWVDPLKEAMATIRLIDSGLTTRKAEVESRGRDFSRVQKQIDKEKDLFVPAYDRAKASGASEAESANSGGGRIDSLRAWGTDEDIRERIV